MKRAILLGGGDSISEGIDLGLFDKIKEEEVWSINFAFMTISFLPKREVWCDIDFFKKNTEKLQELYKKGVPCYAKDHSIYKNIPEINKIKCTRDINVKDDSLFIGRLGLSGTFALALAVKENYDELFLLGYDFGINGTRTHYYQDKVQTTSRGVGDTKVYMYDNRIHPGVQDFEVFVKPNIKIYNVSMISRIPYFEKITYSKMFEKLNGTKIL